MVYKYNPFEDIFEKTQNQTSAAKEIELTVEAGENLSALKLVYIESDGKAYLATSQGTYNQALVVGMTKTVLLAGDTGNILVFGKIDDPFFNYVGAQDLYLTTNGSLSNVAPVTGHVAFIGQSLNTGSIFLNTKNIIVL